MVAADLVEALGEKFGVALRTLCTLPGAALEGCTYRHPLFDRTVRPQHGPASAWSSHCSSTRRGGETWLAALCGWEVSPSLEQQLNWSSAAAPAAVEPCGVWRRLHHHRVGDGAGAYRTRARPGGLPGRWAGAWAVGKSALPCGGGSCFGVGVKGVTELTREMGCAAVLLSLTRTRRTQSPLPPGRPP